MSHRVNTTLSDDTWGALDRWREDRDIESEAEAVRRIVEMEMARERAEITGASQMLVIHPSLSLAEASATTEEGTTS